jgi:hypothetical protein
MFSGIQELTAICIQTLLLFQTHDFYYCND